MFAYSQMLFTKYSLLGIYSNLRTVQWDNRNYQYTNNNKCTYVNCSSCYFSSEY